LLLFSCEFALNAQVTIRLRSSVASRYREGLCRVPDTTGKLPLPALADPVEEVADSQAEPRHALGAVGLVRRPLRDEPVAELRREGLGEVEGAADAQHVVAGGLDGRPGAILGVEVPVDVEAEARHIREGPAQPPGD